MRTIVARRVIPYGESVEVVRDRHGVRVGCWRHSTQYDQEHLSQKSTVAERVEAYDFQAVVPLNQRLEMSVGLAA